MARNVWLIISDLHLYHKNISSRKDYVEEMNTVCTKIVEIAAKYKNNGFDSVNFMLLGDVFHRSYRNTFKTGYDNNFFVLLSQKFGKCYSVIGNHELSFYESNPFFTLVNTIESKKVQAITDRVWTPRGLLPTIQVVDRVDDGNVHFFFNHYGTSISIPETAGVNIGLFHQEIVCQEIINVMKQRLHSDIWASTVDFEKLDVFDGYQHCFLGHMHKVYGTWQGDNGCVLHYLASLGRTNVGEISDDFLERDIPAIVVENGDFSTVESNKFNLMSPSDCLVQAQTEENKHIREIQKIREYTKNFDVLGDNPIENLETFFGENPKVLTIIDGLLKNDIDEIGESLRNRFNGGIL